MDSAMIKWITSPEAKKIAASTQDKAWKALQQQYPRADRSKFEIEVYYSKKISTRLPRRYFSKAIQAYRRVFLAQIRDIGALK